MATRTTKKRIVRKENTNVNDKGQILEEEEEIISLSLIHI